MRLVLRAQSPAQEHPQRQAETAHHADVGSPRGTRDATVEFEDEEPVQRRIHDGDQTGRHHRDARPRNAVEEAEHGPQRDPERRSEHARLPERHRLRGHVGRETERREQQRTRPRKQREERQRQCAGRERDPGGVARTREATAAFGLRHERLDRESDAADQHQEQQHYPVDRGHAGHRCRRDVADEPGVGEADHRLQAAVEHQRQRQRRDGAVVDDGAPRGRIALLCRQRQCIRQRDGVRPGRRRVDSGHGGARITGASVDARKNSTASPGTRAGRPPTG